MNRHQWTVAILRVLAIWWIARAAVALPSVVFYWVMLWRSPPQKTMQTIGVSLQVGAVLIEIVLAVLIWVMSGKLARLIWRGGPEAPQPAPLGPGSLQTGLFSATGLVLIGLAIPGFTANLVELYFQPSMASGDLGSFGHPGARMIGFLLQVAFGLWLFLYPGFFAGIVPRRWYPGQGRTDG